MMNIYLVLLLSVAANSQAATPKFCKPIAAIERKIELCDDNSQFAQAAEDCLKAFKKHVEAEQATLKTVLLKGVDSANQQKDSEAVSAESYASAIAKLSALIVEGAASRVESKNYISHFIWPFHWTKEMGPVPKNDDPNLWKTFDGEYCYGEHRETIDHMLKDFDKTIAELTKAKMEALAMKASSESRKKNFDAGTTGGNTVTSTTGKSGAGKSAAPSNGESDITGTDKKKTP